MTPEARFRNLEACALASLSSALDGSDPIASSTGSVVVRIWQHPAFDPHRSWFLIRANRGVGDAWLVRKVTWNRPIDQARAMDPLRQVAFMVEPEPRPTMEALEARVGESFSTRVLAQLQELGLTSLFPRERLGLDGVVNGLETQMGRLRLEWWCDGPPEWRELTEGVERIRIALDEAVLSNPALQPPPQCRRG